MCEKSELAPDKGETREATEKKIATKARFRKKMAKKRNSRGKEISDETVEVEDVKAALSEKLFATDRCPCERVHMYSTIDNLLWVRNKLDGTPEMEKLMGSWFGSLFKISKNVRSGS
ncbi:hypothetical protein YC2023_059396 [Brassica napus]